LKVRLRIGGVMDFKREKQHEERFFQREERFVREKSQKVDVQIMIVKVINCIGINH
jgi:hypothetical protein